MDHVMYANQKRDGWCKGYLQPTSSAIQLVACPASLLLLLYHPTNPRKLKPITQSPTC